MRSNREKGYQDAQDLELKMKAIKSIYQNPMVVTAEHNDELKIILNNLREELNDSVIKAIDYLDSITIGDDTVNQRIAKFAYRLGMLAESNGQDGDHELSKSIFEEEQQVLDYLSGGDISKQQVLELYKSYNLGKSLDEEFNGVNIFGYQFVNMYGKHINREEYVVIVKRIYNQAKSLVKNQNKKVFNVAVNEGSGLLALLALHQLKLKFSEIKINICLPFEGCINRWGVDSKNLYKQLEHLADRITYIDEELNVYPKKTDSNRLQVAFMDYFNSKSNTSIAVYTQGCKGEKLTEDFVVNANKNGNNIYYIEI